MSHTVHALRPPVAAPLATVQGTLALDLAPRLDPPECGPAPGRPGGDVVPVDHELRRRMEQWAHRYAQAVVEIVGGDRPVTQLLRWTTPEVYANLSRRAQLAARAGGHQAGQGRSGPVVRPQVLGVRTCFLSTRQVEVSVHVRYGRRWRAIGARFDRREDRWLCTALEFA